MRSIIGWPLVSKVTGSRARCGRERTRAHANAGLSIIFPSSDNAPRLRPHAGVVEPRPRVAHAQPRRQLDAKTAFAVRQLRGMNALLAVEP